jgi:outer membrane protein assembly factor BamB
MLGGSCVHDPPNGFASPNGDTPLPGGGVLVTEIGGWVDRLSRTGRLLWSVRSPVPYPSDAQLLPHGRILATSFTDPGRIVLFDRHGRVHWSFGAASGRNRLDKPSLAVRLSNGMIAANDDYNDRVIVIDPATKRIVWQYGHTGVAGRAPGFLDKPDGLDPAPLGISLKARAGRGE